MIASRLLLGSGYDGLNFNPLSGTVLEVDPQGPSAGLIEPGDRVISIEGVPVEQAPPLLAEHDAGDRLTYLVSRAGGQSEVQLTLRNNPTRVALQYLVTPLVAASFWLIGVAVMAFAPGASQARLFLAFALIVTSTLVTGSISSEGPNWASTLFNILVWFAGPVAVQLHLRFPEPVGDRWLERLPLPLYALATVGSLPFALAGAEGIRASPLNASMFTAERLFLSINLLLVVMLLLRAYRVATNVMVRQRVRLVALGGGLGLLLVIALSLIPGALLSAPLIPYDFSFAFLIAIPASYGYAIARHRLMGFERYLSRGAAYTLVFAALAAIYLGLTSLIEQLLPSGLLATPLINMLMILLLAGTAVLLYRRIQALVDFAFYGGWYNFRTALEQITNELEQLRDRETLAVTLGQRLQSTLRLQSACVFVTEPNGALRLPPSEVCHLPDGTTGPLSLPAGGSLVHHLTENRRSQWATELAEAVTELPLTRDERTALQALAGCLLVPVPGAQGLQGLLALGPRRGGEPFAAEDTAILHQVARHAGVAIETVRLTSEVGRQAEEVRRLNMRMTRAREDERRALARQLHDDTIQALIGLNYQLGDGSPRDLREDLRRVVEQLRGMIRELRPPTLDSFGLVAAVRTEVRERQARHPDGLRIDLHQVGDPETVVGEDAAICVYRVIQEALNNVERHADAHRVEVQLILQPDQVQLMVQDDGRGFEVPQPLGALVGQDHFGLIGMRERVQLLRGTLDIHSSPGEGTQLHVRIPLPDGSQHRP